MSQYSLAEKLAGQDLHGLSCRIPKPTPEQSKCPHSETVAWDDGYEDWDGEWRSDWKKGEQSTYDDIPGTNNLKCRLCGYTRRY